LSRAPNLAAEGSDPIAFASDFGWEKKHAALLDVLGTVKLRRFVLQQKTAHPHPQGLKMSQGGPTKCSGKKTAKRMVKHD
jgi:hypothetical protein